MQEMPLVSELLNDRSAGRWAVALAATAALMVGGGFLGCAGSALADGKPDNNVGSPGGDGQDATCFPYMPTQENSLCNFVGEEVEDTAPGAVDR